MEPKQYPVSEIFVSPQGEGVFTGVMMCFIRLAGCTVGRPYPKEMYQERYSTDTSERPLHLPIYTERCELYDGRTFSCDSDYRVKERLTLDRLLEKVPVDVRHICITGGEPLMHDLTPLLNVLEYYNKTVHIETSGTIMFTPDITRNVWVTVAPKKGVLVDMIVRANEIKLLVDETFSPTKPIQCLSNGTAHEVFPIDLAKGKPTYLHPVNGEHSISAKNLALCKQWQEQFKDFRIGIQLHKAMTAALGEIIR